MVAVTSARAVEAVIIGSGLKHLVKITIDTGDIRATAEHPIWLEARGAWVNAGLIQVGDRLTDASGAGHAVLAVEAQDEVTTVYNLTVASVHTYYVSAGGQDVLVHHAGCSADGWSWVENLDEHFAKHGPEMGYESQIEYREAAVDLTCACGGRRPGVKVKQEGITKYYFDPESGEFAITGTKGIVTFYKSTAEHFDRQPGTLIG